MKSSRRTPSAPRCNRASNLSAQGHSAKATTVKELFTNTMKSIPECEQSHGSGVEDFLNGKATPSRSRRSKARPSGKTTPRRLATPTQSKTKSEFTAEDGKRSDDTSYNRSGVNENDGYYNNRKSSSKSHYRYFDTPKKHTKDRSSHKGKESYSLSPNKSPTEIVLSPAKKVVAAAKNIASSRKQKLAVRKVVKVDASTQTDGEEVCSVYLKEPVTRSLQNRRDGNLDRSCLGTGYLRVFKYTSNNEEGERLICRFIDDDGNLKFEAELPNSKVAHDHMHLKPLVENSIEWYAYDTSEAPPSLRAFYISFNDGADMFATLLHFFGGKDIDIVKEFLGKGSRFVQEKEILPPHSIVKNENDMDVNSDDEEYAPPPLSKEEEVEKYGCVSLVSQAF